MSTDPGQGAAFQSSHVESIRRCAQHVRLWLGATGLGYSGAAREAFVRAHPVLFGRAYEVTLRGYDRWRARRAVADTVDGFVRYIAGRHERWISVNRLIEGLAPCLIGTANQQPCWITPNLGAGAQTRLRAA